MSRRLVSLAIALFLVPGLLLADQAQSRPDIAGNWQGTLTLPAARIRILLTIARSADGNLAALNYAIDQSPQPMQTSAVSLRGNTFTYTVPTLHGTYEGQFSGDGNTITGMWAQNNPLTFVRATKETAWEIPKPPPPPKPMAADANPSFDVATIKPSNPDASGKTIRVVGRSYQTRNTSLADLIEVAYGLHPKQIAGAPSWVFEEKFDLQAVPDGEGQPSIGQWLTMVQKLLSDRFGLAFHHETRELSAYVITVAKNAPANLVKSTGTSPFPTGLEFRPVAGGLFMSAKNATIGQLAQMMQQVVLDLPVVDRTGWKDRLDFQLTFVPNDSQFNGHPPAFLPATSSANAIPALPEAMQQQLGLKLSVEKIATGVLVVDGVHRPTAD